MLFFFQLGKSKKDFPHVVLCIRPCPPLFDFFATAQNHFFDYNLQSHGMVPHLLNVISYWINMIRNGINTSKIYSKRKIRTTIFVKYIFSLPYVNLSWQRCNLV